MLELQTKSVLPTPSSRDATASVYSLYKEYGTLRMFPKDSFVYMKGDAPVSSYYVENGLLKVCQFTEEGRDVTFFIRRTGDAFGLAEIILQQNHPCYAQCLHDSLIWVLDAAIVHEKINTDPDVNREVLYTITHRLIHHQSTVELLISKPVAWRLAWLLQQLSVTSDAGNAKVDAVLNHEEISNIIGCSRQTVSELLSKWKAQGCIDYDRKQIVIRNLKPILGEL